MIPNPQFANGMLLLMAGATLLLIALSLLIQHGELTDQLFSAAIWFGFSTALFLGYIVYGYMKARRKP